MSDWKGKMSDSTGFGVGEYGWLMMSPLNSDFGGGGGVKVVGVEKSCG
jgi:hypothetical protein